MGGSDHTRSDEDFEADIHDFRELLRTRDREGLESALASPELYRLACDDERYLGLVMQGISALAWDEPAKASEHLVHFDSQKSREEAGSDARRAARALLAALEWRQLEAHSSLPMGQMTSLREYLQLYPALHADPDHGLALKADMRANPERYVDFFEGLARHAHGLPEWIARLPMRSGQSPEPLDVLNEEQISAMSVAVAELREILSQGPSRYLLGISVLGTVTLMPNAVGVLIAVLLVLGFFTLGERKSYDQVVRPRLIRLAIEHGVGARAVVTWIYKLRRQAGRMSQFDIKIENDHALELLAAVAYGAGVDTAASEGD